MRYGTTGSPSVTSNLITGRSILCNSGLDLPRLYIRSVNVLRSFLMENYVSPSTPDCLASVDRFSSATPQGVVAGSSTDAPLSALSRRPKAVVVHAGARDAYQLALALQENGLLDRLFTDLFWPAEASGLNRLASRMPGFHRQALQRSAAGIPYPAVQLSVLRGLLCLAAERVRRLPPELRRLAHRTSDAALGKAAGQWAREHGAGLVSYSYYGYDAMRPYGRPAMLFQVHPHPVTVRRILQQELEAFPECAESLEQEWELALPEEDFEHLVTETRMASRFLAASSFTRNSLVENGAAFDSVSVIPYGVDLQRFRPAAQPRVRSPKLQLLFVGRINQRKGVKYLLEALKMFRPEEVQLTICGRVVDSLSLFRDSGLAIDIRPSVSSEELVRAYQSADLFIFPSVAEGFAQVLLESLACGLPILSTTHTAAPDLITEGHGGFIVEPRRPDLLAERITWCLEHRDALEAMRAEARATAERFTWERFRSHAAEAVRDYLATVTS